MLFICCYTTSKIVPDRKDNGKIGLQSANILKNNTPQKVADIKKGCHKATLFTNMSMQLSSVIGEFNRAKSIVTARRRR